MLALLRTRGANEAQPGQGRDHAAIAVLAPIRSLDEFEATMSGLLRPCRVQGPVRTRYRTEFLHGKLDCVGPRSLGGSAQVRVSGEKGISLLQIPLRGGFAATDGRGTTHHFVRGDAAHVVAPDSSGLLDFQPGTRMLIVDLRQQQLEAMGGAALFTRIARDRPSVSLSSATTAPSGLSAG